MPVIRAAKTGDAAAIAAIYAPFVAETVVSFELTAPDAGEIARRMAAGIATHPWLVAEDAGAVAGYAYAGRFNARAAYDWSAEVTIYLAPDYRRRGLGRRLYDALFRLLRRQGFHSLFALIALPNEASLGLHRACGMREIGVYREVGCKFGQWRDVLSMGMTLNEARAPARPPIAFADLDPCDDDLR